METRMKAGVVMLGILLLIVLSTLTLALAALVGEDSDAEDWSQYRADAEHSGYTANELRGAENYSYDNSHTGLYDDKVVYKKYVKDKLATCYDFCENAPITPCINDDGCCPSGCNPKADNDCTPNTYPVLLVHGWGGSSKSMSKLKENLETDCYPQEVYDIDFPGKGKTQRISEYGEDVEEKVDKIKSDTGADKVIIIAHGMGGLASRYYIKSLGGDESVDTLIMLGTPNHGTSWATFAGKTATDMRHSSKFLEELNSGDETPGNVRYITVAGTSVFGCDGVVCPKSVHLDGAKNYKYATTHTKLHDNKKVYKRFVKDKIATCYDFCKNAPITSCIPVLLVHGWGGSSKSMSKLKENLETDCYPQEVYDIDFPGKGKTQRISEYGEDVEEKVDKIKSDTGADKVIIIAHSMGGLASRYYIKSLGGDESVDTLIMLGTPNHGTHITSFCWGKTCKDMKPDSEFLKKLNSGDETPGNVRYITVAGTSVFGCDGVVCPKNVRLDGADEYKYATTHTGLHDNKKVYKRFVKDKIATCYDFCKNAPITSCINNDGCCPSECYDEIDNDCSKKCTNVRGAPFITSYAPTETPVFDDEGATRTFNVTVNRIANVTWLINGTQVQVNTSATEASYTNTSAVEGTWYITAVASNAKGTDMQIWIWSVKTPPASVTNLNATAVGYTWINWSWTNPPDSDFSHTMIYDVDYVWKTNVPGAPGGTSYINTSEFKPNRIYTIRTHTTDTSGNVNETGVNDSAATLTTPYYVNMSVNTTAQTVVIGKTATYKLTVTNWGTANDNYTLTVENVTGADTAELDTYTITNLSENDAPRVVLLHVADVAAGTYIVKVTVKSDTDPTNVTDTVSTETTVDVTPPASVTNLNATAVGYTWINWSWTNPPDSDFSHTMIYDVLKNVSGAPGGTSYLNTSGIELLPDTSYTIRTRTVDETENVNETWVNDSARTLPAPRRRGGGGGGTYPPGWFETPTPTVTATKATASATGTATPAPPGERVTPAPTRKTAAAKAAAPAAEETTTGKPKKGPGFTAVFVIAGMLAVVYAMMRRRE